MGWQTKKAIYSTILCEYTAFVSLGSSVKLLVWELTP